MTQTFWTAIFLTVISWLMCVAAVIAFQTDSYIGDILAFGSFATAVIIAIGAIYAFWQWLVGFIYWLRYEFNLS